MAKHHLAATAMGLLGLIAATAGHTAATSGSIWINQTSNSAATIPSGTPDANFTPGVINYNPTNSTAVYTIGPFLNNPTFTNESSAFMAAGGPGMSLSFGTGNTFFDVTGTIGLKHGNNSFVVAHDDGVVLNITGFGTVVDQPGPTARSTTPFNVSNPGPAGNFAFNLQYVECCTPPATLTFAINDVVVGGGVPEPATWAMMTMGVGFVGAIARRRRGQTVAAA